MNKTIKWIIISLLGFAVLFFIIRAVTNKGNNQVKVIADVVKQRTVTETVSASGKLYPETEIKVGSPVAGEVNILNVQEGDTVTKGQVLAHIQGDKNNSGSQRVSLP